MYFFLVILVILLALYYYIVIIKFGNFSFWKLAAKDPDFVYEQLLLDKAWIVDESENNIDMSCCFGPFSLFIPSLGRTIKFYGIKGEFEQSQKRVEEKLKLRIK